MHKNLVYSSFYSNSYACRISWSEFAGEGISWTRPSLEMEPELAILTHVFSYPSLVCSFIIKVFSTLGYWCRVNNENINVLVVGMADLFLPPRTRTPGHASSCVGSGRVSPSQSVDPLSPPLTRVV